MKKRLTAEQWQQEFRQLLNETIVTFHYRKKDRTLRKAIGTTCLDLIPSPTPDSSVANEGFAPLCGAAATPVAALKTPVASPAGRGAERRKRRQREGYVNYYDFTVSGWRTLRLKHVTSYVLPEAGVLSPLCYESGRSTSRRVALS